VIADVDDDASIGGLHGVELVIFRNAIVGARGNIGEPAPGLPVVCRFADADFGVGLPCGLFAGTRYGDDQIMPPSVERSIQVSSSARRCSDVVRSCAACQRASLSAGQPDAFFKTSSYAREVNVVTSSEPDGVSTMPASRSSIGESSRTSGQLQWRPPSRDRISSTRPNGQTWASRPPE
jgi:hypothetical protein